MARCIDIQGHRGARALFPENTVEGFLAAAARGVTAFELDVGMTADGVVVVNHDLALNPDLARDASGAWLKERGPLIGSLTLAELRRYDVGCLRPGSPTALRFPEQTPIGGARIPSLAAVLSALPEARFTVEIKTDPRHPHWTVPPDELADATLAVIDEAGAASRVMVESFDWRVQRHVRRVRPEIRLAWLTCADTARESALWWDGITCVQSVAECVAAEGGPVWAPDYTDLTEGQIRQAQELGLTVLPWTVNRPEDIKRLVDWGVDGLISDRPDLALSIAAGA